MHLKAFPTDAKSCHQREAQALVAAGILSQSLALDSKYIVSETRAVATTLGRDQAYAIVCGDMNDFNGERLDAAGSKPTSRVRTLDALH